MKEWAAKVLNEYFVYMPRLKVIDIVEIIIIAFVVYKIALWIKNTKAWMLLRGILMLAVFVFVAVLFKMNTILWIVQIGRAHV